MDQTMMILAGLPASGKSTWATAWRDRYPQRRVIVNRDALRHELFGQYSGLSEEQEQVITVAETNLATCALRDGKSVAVDATNLEHEHRDGWIELAGRHGVPYEVVNIASPLAECLHRNRARAAAGGRFVAEQVIRDMHAAAACRAVAT